MSLIPRDGWVRPGHWLCRLRGHSDLHWEERSEEVGNGVTRTWLAAATCACGRAQPKVLVRFPPPYSLAVQGAHLGRARLADLAGLMPDLAGGRDAVDYVRSFRDDDEPHPGRQEEGR